MADRAAASNPVTGSVSYVDPEGLHKNPAFTNVVVVEGPVRTVHVGGQNAADSSGNVVGKGDVAAQTRQVLANLRTARSRNTSSSGASTSWRARTSRRPSPPSGARGTTRRARRPSPARLWRGSPTRITWWRWTPSPSCPYEPRRGPRSPKPCLARRRSFACSTRRPR